jgi:hypothetical protein
MKIKSIAIIIVLCTSIFFSGCTGNDELIGSTHNSYHVSLLPVNGTAIVFLPIAVNKDGTVSDVMKNLTVCYPNGTLNPNVVNEIIDTEHGKALKIITNEQVEVKNNINSRGAVDQNFSMWSGILPFEEYYAIPIGSIWIYLDNSSTAENVNVQNIEIDSSYELLTGNAGSKIQLDHPVNNITVLKGGWNAYPIYRMRY